MIIAMSVQHGYFYDNPLGNCNGKQRIVRQKNKVQQEDKYKGEPSEYRKRNIYKKEQNSRELKGNRKVTDM